MFYLLFFKHFYDIIINNLIAIFNIILIGRHKDAYKNCLSQGIYHARTY